MFADITPRWAADVFPDDTPWTAPLLIHGNGQAPWQPDHHGVRGIGDYLDEPALRHSRGSSTPVASVWHITIAGVTDIADLDDAECAAITKDVAIAAGVQDGDDAVTRWVAARSHQNQTLHVIASVIGENAQPLSVDREGVHRACRDIDERIHAQNHAPLQHIGGDDLDHGVVVIRDNPELGVAHTLGADSLAEMVLQRAGFRAASLGSGFQAWRTPYGADLARRAHIASTAFDLLSAVGYTVNIQTNLLTRPMPDHDIGLAERRITELTEGLDFCFGPEDAADVTSEVNATLDAITRFTHALGAWAQHHLGDDDYTARLADTATLLDQAAAVINRDPADAPDPRANHMATRAATTRPTAWTVPIATPTAAPPAPSAGPPPRHTR